jgi:hypothetical protein
MHKKIKLVGLSDSQIHQKAIELAKSKTYADEDIDDDFDDILDGDGDFDF